MIAWRRKATQYGPSAIVGYLGKWVVGSVYWNGSRPKGHDVTLDWKVNNFLPGLKTELGAYPTQESAKARLESVVQHWLAGTKADPPEGD